MVGGVVVWCGGVVTLMQLQVCHAARGQVKLGLHFGLVMDEICKIRLMILGVGGEVPQEPLSVQSFRIVSVLTELFFRVHTLRLHHFKLLDTSKGLAVQCA